MFNSIIAEFGLGGREFRPRMDAKDVPLEAIRSLPDRQQQRLVNQGVGVEIEAEHVASIAHGLEYWIVDVDNSLRDSGREFKTKLGIRLGHLPKAFHEFSKAGKYKYSERTSTHVHMDARKLTLKEILSLLGVYTVFEDSLFEFAGDKRKHNIFCVPLRHSHAASPPQGVICSDWILGWNKYSAINLRSLREFGTVEFRHMEGHDDMNRLMNWVLLLGMLMDYVKMTPFEVIQKEIQTLKLKSNYFEFARKVFGPLQYLLKYLPQDLDESVSDAKLWLSDLSVKQEVTPRKSKSSFVAEPRGVFQMHRMLVEPAVDGENEVLRPVLRPVDQRVPQRGEE